MVRYLFGLPLLCLFLGACATTDYVGESYAPTSHVDVYFDVSEIDRPYKIMGTAKTEGTEYLTFEVIEQQLVEDAMAKGADAIVIDGLDTVTVGSTATISGRSGDKPRYVVTEDGELKNVGGDGSYSAVSTSTEVRDKVVSARLIKYQ